MPDDQHRNRPDSGSSGPKPTCSPAVPSLDVSAFKTTDGAYQVPAAKRRDFVWPTTPGWHDIACIHGPSLENATMFVDSALTRERCQATCIAAGKSYTAVGYHSFNWVS